jgi:hypothetical protein
MYGKLVSHPYKGQTLIYRLAKSAFRYYLYEMEALQLISAFRAGVDNGVIDCCEAFGLLEELMCVWLTFILLTLLARLKIITIPRPKPKYIPSMASQGGRAKIKLKNRKRKGRYESRTRVTGNSNRSESDVLWKMLV